MSLAFQGRPADARAIAEDTLAEACALGLRRVEGSCLNALAVIAGMQDDEIGALQFDQRSLDAYRAGGDRRNEAIAQGNIGIGWLGLGALARARRELEEGLRLMRVNGERGLEVSPLCALATLALWQGHDAQALAHARAAVEIAVAVQARDQEIAAWCREGEAELALGRHAAATRAFASAQARAVEIGSAYRHDAAAGWRGSPWREATPRRRDRRWQPCWHCTPRRPTTTTCSRASSCRAWSSGRVIVCSPARATRSAPSGSRAPRRASASGGDDRGCRPSRGLPLKHSGPP